MKTTTTRTPVLFVGHGAPTNVIEDNEFSRGFKKLPTLFEKPKAILVVSAHWYVSGVYLTSNPNPKTIYDFSGFPQAMYEFEYKAPGSIDLAAKARQLIGEQASLSEDWGYDHGTWTVLELAYPAADIPVIQLSIDRTLTPQQHLEIAKTLRPLRDEGVLIMGSGNITHNLRHAMGQMRRADASIPEWARQFDSEVLSAVQNRDLDHLAKILSTEHGKQSHPTPDHYIPLLYAAGAADDKDELSSPIEGWLASLSMRSLLLG